VNRERDRGVTLVVLDNGNEFAENAGHVAAIDLVHQPIIAAVKQSTSPTSGIQYGDAHHASAFSNDHHTSAMTVDTTMAQIPWISRCRVVKIAPSTNPDGRD
jgi:hypothetical protein